MRTVSLLMTLAAVLGADCALAQTAVGVPTPMLITNAELCGAAAAVRRSGVSSPALEREIVKRGLPCGEAGSIAAASARPTSRTPVGACTSLTALGVESVSRGSIYTIRNSAPRTVSFKINHAGVTASAFTIGPNRTQQFGVERSGFLNSLGRAANAGNADVDTIQLYDCR